MESPRLTDIMWKFGKWQSKWWKDGTTNCEEEQECEILSKIFTKPSGPRFSFKLKKMDTWIDTFNDRGYVIASHWGLFLTLNYKNFYFRTKPQEGRDASWFTLSWRKSVSIYYGLKPPYKISYE